MYNVPNVLDTALVCDQNKTIIEDRIIKLKKRLFHIKRRLNEMTEPPEVEEGRSYLRKLGLLRDYGLNRINERILTAKGREKEVYTIGISYFKKRKILINKQEDIEHEIRLLKNGLDSAILKYEEFHRLHHIECLSGSYAKRAHWPKYRRTQLFETLIKFLNAYNNIHAKCLGWG